MVPLPMRSAQDGLGSLHPPGLQTQVKARVLCSSTQSEVDRHVRSGIKINVESHRPGELEVVKSIEQKNPSVATCSNERRSGRTSKTPAPASTLVFSHSLLPFAPVANRGQVSKVLHQFANIESTPAARRHAVYFQHLRASRRRRRAPCGPIGVSV